MAPTETHREHRLSDNCTEIFILRRPCFKRRRICSGVGTWPCDEDGDGGGGGDGDGDGGN